MYSVQLQAVSQLRFQTTKQQPSSALQGVQRGQCHRAHIHRPFVASRAAENCPSTSSQRATVCNSHAGEHAEPSPATESAADGVTSVVCMKSFCMTVLNPLKVIFGRAWRKAIPLSVLFFSATYVFTILQSLKDGIVVVEMGPEALPFLTTFGSLPASLAYFNFYRNWLVPSCPPEKLFYATALPFLVFYTLFAFVLYPLAPSLQNPSWLSWLPGVLPQGLHGLAAGVQHWVYSLFFVVGDLWGPVMITMAFWTVADEVCTMSEAAALYPQLGLLANLGLVGSAGFTKAVHAAVGGNMASVLKVMVGAMWGMSCLMFACKALINRRYIKPKIPTPHSPPKHAQQQQQVASLSQSPSANSTEPAKPRCNSDLNRKTKAKTSWNQATEVLSQNPKAAELTTWVVSFGIAFRLCEYCFKAQLRSAAADSAAYCCALADVNSWIGGVTIAMMLSSKVLFRRLGWSGAALVSPAVLLILGSTFFTGCLLAQAAAAAATPAAAAAAVGPQTAGLSSAASGGIAAAVTRAVQQVVTAVGGPDIASRLASLALAAGAATNVAAAACRHSLFTPSKEMVYKTIPPAEVKESKAVVDLIGGQVAKSGAGWIVQLLLLACGSISGALPAMAAMYLTANLAWLRSTLTLCKDMRHYEQQQAAAAKAAARQQQQQQTQQWQQQQGNMLRQQLLLWQRQWQAWQPQQQRWELPLPGELAFAAAAVYDSQSRTAAGSRVPPAGGNGTGRSSERAAAITRHQLQQQLCDQRLDLGAVILVPPMLQDAVYWDATYAAINADSGLLESVVLGWKAAAVVHQQQQPMQHVQQESVDPPAVQATVVVPKPHSNMREPGSRPRVSKQLHEFNGGFASLRQGLPDVKGAALTKEALHTLFES